MNDPRLISDAQVPHDLVTLQVLRDAVAERPVRELILVDSDEHVARLAWPVRAQRVNANERHRISSYWIGWICG
jgi:hypothetical protein